MSERGVIESQLVRKNTEIQSLEERLKVARVYVRALEDILRALDKQSVNEGADAEPGLRRGSMMDQARDILLRRGKPIHIDELVRELGRDVTRESRASLTSSLSAYVRRGEIFTRTAPSTFGLAEFGQSEDASSVPLEPVPPPDFGPRQEDDDIPF